MKGTCFTIVVIYASETHLNLKIERGISLNVYADDFEICNPLGTSNKNTKSVPCIGSWVIGHQVVTPPFINDLITLEQHGIL